MKQKSLSWISFIIVSAVNLSFAQETKNLDFEIIERPSGNPMNWWGSFSQGSAPGYVAVIDSLVKVKGKYAFSIAIDSSSSTRTFGVCSYSIPAQYEGTKIRLQGYLKTENISTEGFAGLWMRIDGPTGVLAFNNMEEKKIIGTNDWKEYTIDLPLDEDAETIIVGGLMVGNTGKIWLDNLRIFIDEKEFEKVPAKKIKVYKAQQDTSFVHGSHLSISQPNPKSIKNLTLLAQVWGFLKYYHPAIAAGNYNWDFELFRFLPSYVKATNNKARDKTLLDWINKLGPIEPCTSCSMELGDDLKMKPDFGWFESADLDPLLKKKLEDVRRDRNLKKNYYVSMAPYVGNPVFTNEDPYKQFVLPDDGFRLLALFRYWNMIHYFFPYKYAIGEDWNRVLVEFIPRFIQAKNKLEYKLTALELIGRIHDTHANIWGGDSVLSNHKGKYIPAVQTKFVENKLIVSNYYNPTLGPQSGLEVGDIITSINSIPVEKLITEKLKFYPASNYSTQLRDMGRDMLRGNNRNVELEIQRNTGLISKSVKRFPSESDSLDTSIDWAPHAPDSCYKFVADDIGYIYLGKIQSDLLPKIFKTFNSTKGIVIDIRNYPSEFVVFTLSGYLLDSEKDFVKFTNGDLTYPGAFKWTPALKVGEEREAHYKGKIVLLINEVTQSQAEYTTMAFRTAPNVTVIGSTTAGADGNVSTIYLPGNLMTMISGIGVYYPDGKETQRVGIIPDLEVKPTIRGVREKKDELLEKAIQIIQSKN